jgi:hypothetical protein
MGIFVMVVMDVFAIFTPLIIYKNAAFMKWYQYIACFFAGLFIANMVPHFIHGVSGDVFPTPFSTPAGKGPSSPTINVFWGLLNLVIGYLLMRAGKVSNQKPISIIVFFLGIVLMSWMLSVAFMEKQMQF